MQMTNDIWVQVGEGGKSMGVDFKNTPPSPSSDNYHAVFASLIKLKSFDEILPHKWGFNNDTLLQEALDRQRLFIEAQHTYDEVLRNEITNQRSLAFRCIRYPGSKTLHLVLIGKVISDKLEHARICANEMWQEVHSLFPYEYDLIPAKSFDEFVHLTGYNIIKSARKVKNWLEIRRFEGAYNLLNQQVYLLGMWQQSKRANEQIWRALGGLNQPMLYNVLLRPTIFFDDEKIALQKTIDSLNKIVNAEGYSPNPEIQGMLQNYSQLITQLHFPYCVQIMLVSPSTIPNYLLRAIGSSFCHSEDIGITHPGYQEVRPQNKGLENLGKKLLWLEPDFNIANGTETGSYTRLPYLFDGWSANIAFRFPILPPTGLPSVQFSNTIGE
jgi:hypothetical protein